MSKTYVVCALVITCLSGPAVNATPTTFYHRGSGSGSVGGVPFSESPFLIVATGDTFQRQTGPFSVLFIDHLSAHISITGAGNYTITSGTRTFVNVDGQIVGFSRATVDGTDLYNGPTDPAFASWEMLTSIGPIGGTAALIQWELDPVMTNAGRLIFNNITSAGSFQAIVVPEPMWGGAILAAVLFCSAWRPAGR